MFGVSGHFNVVCMHVDDHLSFKDQWIWWWCWKLV